MLRASWWAKNQGVILIQSLRDGKENELRVRK